MRLVARPLFFDLSLRGAQQRSNLAICSGKKQDCFVAALLAMT